MSQVSDELLRIWAAETVSGAPTTRALAAAELRSARKVLARLTELHNVGSTMDLHEMCRVHNAQFPEEE